MNGTLLDIYLPFLYNPFLRSGGVLGRTAPQAPAPAKTGRFFEYLFFYAGREENRQVKPLIGWVAGLGILLMGFVR